MTSDAAPDRRTDGETIDVTINGQARAVPTGSTVGDFLADRGYAVTMVLVERNGTIVPRADCAATPFVDGDGLEIVHAVGGG